MKTLKILIALLLSLVMVFSLVACGDDSGNGRDDDRDEENEENVEDVDDYTVAQLVVGDWEAKVDITDYIVERFADQLDDEDDADCFKFGKMYAEISMSFSKDGEVEMEVSVDDAIKTFKKGLKNGLVDYAEEVGVDLEEIDGNEDELVESMLDMLSLEDFNSSNSDDYMIDGDEIVIDGEGCEVDFEDVNTFILNDSGFSITDDDDLEFKRVGKFDPPSKKEVKDNELDNFDDEEDDEEDDRDEDEKNTLGTPTTDKVSAEIENTINPSLDENWIVGLWEAQIDITDALYGMLVASMGDGDVEDYFDFDDSFIYIRMEFDYDNSLVLTADAAYMVSNVVSGLEDGIEDYAEANGVDIEELYAELDTDEDHFADDFVEMLGLESLSSEFEGEYEIDGDEIVVDGESLEFDYDGGDAFTVSAYDLGLDTLIEEDEIEFVRK